MSDIYRNKDSLFAYFAGAMDSDGFISIQRSTKKNKSRERHVYFNVRIGFTSAKHSVVQNLLKEVFGGSIYSYKPDNPNHSAWCVWQVSDKRAHDVLLALLPYLIIKKRQAALIIEFVETCARQRAEMKRTQKPPYRVTAEMLATRTSYWEQVLALNSLNGGFAAMSDYVAPHYSPLTSMNRA